MNAFRFPLQKALDWRSTQLELEEARFKQQGAMLAGIDREREAVQTAGASAEAEVRENPLLAGRDLAALGAFRLHIRNREKQIALRRAECRQKLAAQEAVMLEARRRCRLLERLKDRRVAEWETARDKEIEQMAAESFLARWARR